MIDTQEIIDTMERRESLMEKWTLDKKSIIGMIRYVKECFSHISVYDRYDPDGIDEQVDNGIRILEIMDEIFSKPEYDKTEIITQNVNDNADWHYVIDGDLPPTHTDVLFCNKVEQVFEGFLEQYDTKKPFLTEDKKIAFPKYEDGGKWFDFRFRSYHDMSRVIAWRYKPVPPKGGKK